MQLKTIASWFLLLCGSPIYLFAQSLHPFTSGTSSEGIHAYSSILSIEKTVKGLYILTQKNGCFLIEQNTNNKAIELIKPKDRRDHFSCFFTNNKDVYLWANEKEFLVLGNQKEERLTYCSSFFIETVAPENIVIDRQENIYVGTATDGVFIFTKEENGGYSHLPKRISTIDGQLPSNNIQCLYRMPNDIIWIGTDAGIASIKDGLVHNYSTETSSIDKQKSYFSISGGSTNNFLSQSIYAMSSWGNSLILAGENDVYRALLSSDSIEYLHKYNLPSRLTNPLSNIMGLMVDMDGNLWIAANQLLRYNIPTDKLLIMNEVYSFNGKGFLSVTEDIHARKVWIGTSLGGLYEFRY